MVRRYFCCFIASLIFSCSGDVLRLGEALIIVKLTDEQVQEAHRAEFVELHCDLKIDEEDSSRGPVIVSFLPDTPFPTSISLRIGDLPERKVLGDLVISVENRFGKRFAIATAAGIEIQRNRHLEIEMDLISNDCGNGAQEGTEECDDGDLQNNNECLADCRLNVCGDSHLFLGREGCDDGNLVDGDGCSSECIIEGCGDGVLSVGEECDDGCLAGIPNECELVDNDDNSCLSTCRIAQCGDALVRVDIVDPQDPLFETCDDGNRNNNDDCTNLCRVAVCGDGIVRSDLAPGDALFEECDDGNTDNTDSCTNLCRVAVCGDGIVRSDVAPGDTLFEECDDGNINDTDSCPSNCRNAVCGDGFTQSIVEECDDGNLVNEDACINTCRLARCQDNFVQPGEECDDGDNLDSNGCLVDCTLPACGDGIVSAGEACDDGGTQNNDGCNSQCQSESCGDGILQSTEQCDDGNVVSGDGCRSNCTLEFCGDAIVDADEECDDGNNINTDVCVACSNAFCGDGFVQAGVELCDDGNTIDTDACRASCVPAVCGDGVVRSDGSALTEVCDDNNTTSGDGCRADCKGTEDCGDGFLDSFIEVPARVIFTYLYRHCGTPGPLTIKVNNVPNNSIIIDSKCSCGTETPESTIVTSPGFLAAFRQNNNIINIQDVLGIQLAWLTMRVEFANALAPAYELVLVDALGGTAALDGDSDLRFVLNGPFSANIAGVTMFFGERCDDGNLANGDGCNNICQLATPCHNNIVNPPEQCDSFSDSPVDRCDSNCSSLVSATGPVALAPCNCSGVAAASISPQADTTVPDCQF